jgi:hypothetical protein
MVLFNPQKLQRFAPHFAKPDAAWKVMLVAGVFLVAASSLGMMARFGRKTDAAAERLARTNQRISMTDAVARRSP